MIFQIKQLTAKYEKEWDNFVLANKNSTFYHQIGWKHVIENIYNYKSYYFFAENENGKIIGILPTIYMDSLFFGKRLISLPFSSYAGICTDYDFIKEALVNEVIDLGNKLNIDYCEVRNINSTLISNNLSCMNNYSTYFLNLTKGSEYIWSNMNATTRNRVRKGEKNLNFHMSSNLNEINEFYEIYSINMKHLGTPVHDYRLFKEIYKLFPSQVLISKATLNDNPTSSMYLLKFKNILINGWSASIPDFLKYSPNNFVYWNSIKYAFENKYSYFDFGRSLSSSGNERFKKSWGTVKIPLSYYYYPTSKTLEPPQKKYGRFVNMWSKLPFSMTRKIGPKIRRHLP